jgi:uncharacterized phage infection (PIP) family protein YhgE
VKEEYKSDKMKVKDLVENLEAMTKERQDKYDKYFDSLEKLNRLSKEIESDYFDYNKGDLYLNEFNGHLTTLRHLSDYQNSIFSMLLRGMSKDKIKEKVSRLEELENARKYAFRELRRSADNLSGEHTKDPILYDDFNP